MAQKSGRVLLTSGDLRKQIVTLAIPMVFGMLGITMFNIVDTFYVGRLGTEPLAALSFTFPVVLLLNSIALGLGVGASSVISRALGSGNHDKVVRLTTDSLALSFLFIIMVALLGELTVRPLFSLLGAKGQVHTLVVRYMRIWYAGLPFVVIPMVGNNAIRALGDTKTPGTIMVIAGLVNTAVDPLLIFGLGPFPKWGVAGAAVATVFARSITFTVALYVLIKREKIVSFELPPVKETLASFRAILFVGLPAAITRVIIPVAVAAVTAMLASIGPHAVAGFGVAIKIESFALLFILALATVMAPFAGQNYGAGRIDRVRAGVSYASRLSLQVGGVLFVLLLILSAPLSSLFSKDPEVVAVCTRYLRIVPLVYGLMGVFNILTMVFNALNRPFTAAGFSLLQMFGLYLPLAWAGKALVDDTGIFIALTVAVTIATSAIWLFFQKFIRTMT